MIQPEDRDPFHLPIKTTGDKRRQRLLELYASKVWRLVEQKYILDILDELYEKAYSNGLKDMDLIHKTIDVMIEKGQKV